MESKYIISQRQYIILQEKVISCKEKNYSPGMENNLEG